jgi:hypothetical protein
MRLSYEPSNRMNLLPRKSDYTDARNNNNNNNNRSRGRYSQGRTALDAILDADSDSSDDDEPPASMDWTENWIRRFNEGDDALFRA